MCEMNYGITKVSFKKKMIGTKQIHLPDREFLEIKIVIAKIKTMESLEYSHD